MTIGITVEDGLITEVACRLCGTVIQAMRPSSLRKRKSGDVHIHEYMTTLGPTKDYAEARLSMNDGSMHVTPVCQACRTGLTQAQAVDLYAADLKNFTDPDLHAITPQHLAWVDKQMQRKPIAVLTEDE